MKKQGYTIIEPEIHDELAWDYEQIVQCLNAIIVNYPWTNEETNKFEIEVIPVYSAHNNGIAYPALGLKNVLDSNFDLDLLEQEINNWVVEMGINQLLALGEKCQGKSWKEILVD